MAANASCVSALKLLLPVHFPAAGYQTPFYNIFTASYGLTTRTTGRVQPLDEGRRSPVPGMFRNIRADELAHIVLKHSTRAR